MFKVLDTITGDVLEYDNADDFKEVAKESFDESVHEIIDKLVEAYRRMDYVGEYESYLGIRVL